jgi:hypothetical protein
MVTQAGQLRVAAFKEASGSGQGENGRQAVSASDVIARLRELRAKATAGNWFEDSQRVQDSDRRDYYYNIYAPSGRIIADTLNSDMVLLEDNGEGASLDVVGRANAAAIVAAMNSLESLLACAEALEVFARAARSIDVDPPGDHEPSHGRGSVTAGDLRKARLALQALAGGGE